MNGERNENLGIGAWIVAAALLATTSMAQADVWHEVGDAPDLHGGQITTGGSLSAIEGFLDATGQVGVTGADMYMIRVDDWSTFSANTSDDSGLVSPYSDTSLYLFDINQNGIAYNEDADGSTTRALLEPGNPIYAGRTNGETVLLVVTGKGYIPTADGMRLWATNPLDVTRSPDGIGAAYPLDSWANGHQDTGSYRITLTGVSAADVPAPASFALLGMTGLCITRRRRRV